MRLIDADELKRIAGEAHSMKLSMENVGIGTIAALTFAVQDAGLSTLARIADDIPTIDPESLRCKKKRLPPTPTASGL